MICVHIRKFGFPMQKFVERINLSDIKTPLEIGEKEDERREERADYKQMRKLQDP